jgi:hypothetical protein
MTLPDDPISTRNRGEGPWAITVSAPTLTNPQWPEPVETKERGESPRGAPVAGASLPYRCNAARLNGIGELTGVRGATTPAPPSPSNPRTAVRGESPGGRRDAGLTVPSPVPQPEPDDTAIRGEASSTPRPTPTPVPWPREPSKTFVRGEAAHSMQVEGVVGTATSPRTVLGLLAARQAGR